MFPPNVNVGSAGTYLSDSCLGFTINGAGGSITGYSVSNGGDCQWRW
jgi:hypothetical protein